VGEVASGSMVAPLDCSAKFRRNTALSLKGGSSVVPSVRGPALWTWASRAAKRFKSFASRTRVDAW
jgi:hypothetical protein